MTVDKTKLDMELKAAGIPIEGVGGNLDGSIRIDFQPEATQEQRTLAEEILAAHDPTPDPESDTLVIDKIVQAIDFVVASRDIKNNPKAALEEAVAEARKAKGTRKSLDLISRSLAMYAEDVEIRVDALEKQVAALIKK